MTTPSSLDRRQERSKIILRATITITALLTGRRLCLSAASLPLLSGGRKTLGFVPNTKTPPRPRDPLAAGVPRAKSVMASTNEERAETQKRGAFILFEGVDRCGKTTQANLLVESLKKAGHDACFMRFPGEHTICSHVPLPRVSRCRKPAGGAHVCHFSTDRCECREGSMRSGLPHPSDYNYYILFLSNVACSRLLTVLADHSC